MTTRRGFLGAMVAVPIGTKVFRQPAYAGGVAKIGALAIEVDAQDAAGKLRELMHHVPPWAVDSSNVAWKFDLPEPLLSRAITVPNRLYGVTITPEGEAI